MSLIGKIGETGTCRPAHTALEKQGFEIAASWMQEAGMKTHIDNFGNLIGRLEGKNPNLPCLMMGSHLDSQPYGGRFDGVAGVLCAIEVATTLKENNIQPERSIEIISFADEEGWRFNKGLFGSRGILGKLEEGELVEVLARTSEGSVQAVLAADVFIYLGDLTAVFAAVARVLAPQGLFALSVEGLEGGTYRLQPTGRYAQSPGYLRALAAQYGLEEHRMERTRIRRDGRDHLEGWLALFAKAGGGTKTTAA